MKRFFQLLASLVVAAILTACGAMSGPGAYEAGLNANVQQYKLFSDGQLAQQQTLITCFQHNPNKSECSILTASTNAVSTLAGQPQPLRIAKSTGEILETIADKGLEAAKVIYGVRAVSDAVQAQAKALKDTAAAGSAAQTATAQAGIEAASKPPLVVRPEVIQVPAGSSVLPVTPAE